MTLDALAGTGLERRAVVCSACGQPWDERVVEAGSPALPAGADLCPRCLLQRHGAVTPYPG
ncbi:MAG: hypothetical protein M3P93_01280 [Actinomycetota bacterium]|jgi:NMD protein affecting ribosome stability and mRNA decay|nr:hypothetical protein [Actinomycetota bacterium]